MDAAIVLFGRHGYRGCSLAQIAERAGVGQSGLLYHFGSKEQLLLEVLRKHYPSDRNRPTLRQVMAGGLTFSDLMERVADDNSRQLDLVRFYTVISTESLTEGHPAGDFFRERYARTRAAFADALLATAAPGALTVEEAERLVLLVYAAMDGIQMQWLRDSTLDMREALLPVTRAVRERANGPQVSQRARDGFG